MASLRSHPQHCCIKQKEKSMFSPFHPLCQLGERLSRMKAHISCPQVPVWHGSRLGFQERVSSCTASRATSESLCLPHPKEGLAVVFLRPAQQSWVVLSKTP